MAERSYTPVPPIKPIRPARRQTTAPSTVRRCASIASRTWSARASASRPASPGTSGRARPARSARNRRAPGAAAPPSRPEGRRARPRAFRFRARGDTRSPPVPACRSETYSDGAKTRNLRVFFGEIREAVRLATQPPSNAIRALAMSSFGVSTESPDGPDLGDRASARAHSTIWRSWIMRSLTTSTSTLRPVNAPSRCTSTNRGSREQGEARSRRPGCSARRGPPGRSSPRRAPAPAGRRLRRSVTAIGFSIRTSRPRSRKNPAISA